MSNLVRGARVAAIMVTGFLIFIFAVGQWFILPGMDMWFRVFWGVMLVGLVVFGRVVWKPSARWATLVEAGKWLLVGGVGVMFFLMGLVSIWIATDVPGVDRGLFVFLGGLLLFQGPAMGLWALWALRALGHRSRPAA